MRIRTLVVNTQLAKAWFTIVAACILWLSVERVVGSTAFASADAWVTSHPVGAVWKFSGMQVTALMYLFAGVLLAYVAGQLFLRPVFVRRWAVPAFFVGLAILEARAAIWLALGSIAILGVAYLRVAKGLGRSLAFVPVWKRTVYATAFALLIWLMCGFTAEARDYPAAMLSYVSGSVPQRWAFGFWVPDLAISASVLATGIMSYTLGGYFFDYITRHWARLALLVIFLAIFTPLDRYHDLAMIFLKYGETVLYGVSWAFIGVFTLAVAKSAGEQRTFPDHWVQDDINPATGLFMVGGFDTAGNLYGFSGRELAMDL